MIIKFRRKPTLKYPSAILLSHAGKTFIVLIISILVSYLFFDQPTTLYLQNLPPLFKKIGIDLSNLFDPFFLVCATPILFFLSRLILRKPLLSSTLQLLIFSIPFSLTLIHILKNGFARYRPKKLFTEGLYGFHLTTPFMHDFSFPSGHGCVIGAIVGALACSFPKYTWHLLTLGIFLSLSRVVALDHYLSDVFSGVILGALTSQFLFIFMKKHKITV